MFGFLKKAASEAVEVSRALDVQHMNQQEIYEKQVDKLIEDEGDEWIWVPGWKATDYYMRGYGEFQFEIGQTYKLPDGEEPDVCSKGFHFCPKPQYVRQFYHYGRLFRVEVLIRKSEWLKAEEWVREHPYGPEWGYSMYHMSPTYMKMAAKAVKFIEEVPVAEAREYFYNVDYVATDEEYLDFIKWMADKKEMNEWYFQRYKVLMEQAGISELLARVIWDDVKYKHKGKVVADYAIGLRSSGVGTDMMVYLMTKKASELVASESK